MGIRLKLITFAQILNMKYRIYIDEVGNPDLKSSLNPDHRFLCLTGVVFNVEYVRDIFQPDMEALKAKYFQSDPDEAIIFIEKSWFTEKMHLQF